jgi:hypothetical protein
MLSLLNVPVVCESGSEMPTHSQSTQDHRGWGLIWGHQAAEQPGLWPKYLTLHCL